MKTYPNISRLWGKNIRDAGMTKNQAKKILDENEKTHKVTQGHYESSPPTKNKSSIQNILKKLNVF